MTIKTCVEKAKENSVEISDKSIQLAYTKFYVSMMCIFATLILWALAVLSTISSNLMIIVEIALSGMFIFSLESFLKASTESKESFWKLSKFSKSFWVWAILFVLSLVLVVILKMNFLL